jgi:hypothetical protein
MPWLARTSRETSALSKAVGAELAGVEVAGAGVEVGAAGAGIDVGDDVVVAGVTVAPKDVCTK